MCDPVLLEYVQEVHIDPYVSVYGNYEMPGIYQELFLRNRLPCVGNSSR